MSEYPNNVPIGLEPLWSHQERRLNDIEEAISRFSVGGVDIPKEWIAEKQSLELYLRKRRAKGVAIGFARFAMANTASDFNTSDSWAIINGGSCINISDDEMFEIFIIKNS